MAVSQAILDAIDVVQEKTFAGIINQDYEMVENTFTEDCTFIPPGSAPLKGRAAVILAAKGMSKIGVADMKITKKDKAIPMGEYIFITGEAIMLDKDSKVLDEINFSQIWRQDDDGVWRHLFEMINSRIPPKPPSS